jgi:hypothetical protein
MLFVRSWSARIGVVGLLAGGIALSVNACSGKTVQESAPPAGAGSAAGAGASDSRVSAQNDPACPAADPGESAECTKDGVVCEYGNDFNPVCNAVRACSGGRWWSAASFGDASNCPAPVVSAPNPPACPATRASVPERRACTPSAYGSDPTCSYGATSCTCASACARFPAPQQPPCNPDGGPTTRCCDYTNTQWICFDGPPLCTSPRPRVGSACTEEGAKCALAQPARECGQPLLACTNGTWTLPNVGCPL